MTATDFELFWDRSLLVYSLPAAYLLDLLVGDPRGWPHPVRAMGWLVSRGERWLRRVTRAGRAAGLLLVACVLVATAVTVAATLWSAAQFGPRVRFAAEVLLIGFGLASRSLASETMRVVRAAERSDLIAARRELALIVGRDTESLGSEETHQACIETVAENTTDAVVAPILFTALAGPLGLWLFKAASTMDSMLGHRDERFARFGWAAARLDDVLNFVPARITFLLMPLAALVVGARPLAAWRIGWRDGRKHASPNAGVAEATMAGALGVQLGGPGSYGGVWVDRPLLGDRVRPATADLVRRAIRVMLVTSCLTLGLAEAVLWAASDRQRSSQFEPGETCHEIDETTARVVGRARLRLILRDPSARRASGGQLGRRGACVARTHSVRAERLVVVARDVGRRSSAGGRGASAGAGGAHGRL